MALRVLLADESQTIKKVIQLALQDFSVEVKPVHSGIDVLPIAKVFQPDIIFADVLLAKKTGYDVCKELKSNPETSNIPVVLMWNSLMGIDEKKALESKADRRLEKPFEVETLRSMVQELAPKTVTNPISSFLNFGEIESFKDLNKTNSGDKASTSTAKSKLSVLPDFITKAPPSESAENPDSDFLELGSEEDEFAPVQLNPKITLPESDQDYSDLSEQDKKFEADEWSQKKIETIPEEPLNFKIDQAPLNLDSVSIDEGKKEINDFLIQPEQDFSLPEDDLKKAKIKITENFEEIIFNEDVDPSGLPKAPSLGKPMEANNNFKLPSVDKMPIDAITQENIIREEARVIIEKICWSILPDIAERVVREEIKKLLQDTEKSI